jgi:endonuclease/exonuclease/phosphatase family metal-dependent hydrolase
MKPFLFLFCCFFSFLSTSFGQKALNVMTFNIRYSTLRDSANAWLYRKDKAASQIQFHEAQIVGLQEALHEQVMDLKARLPKFAHVGVARDDGKTKGEYSCILYDSTRLKMLESATFWLSETPEIPGSKSWDAAITRIVTWAKFKDLKSKKTFYLFNTHFDHIGKVARRESAKMLLAAVQRIAGKELAIITGDFNAMPQDEPIQVLLNAPNRILDTKALSKTPHYGPTGTFSGFGPKEMGNDPIDYIFVNRPITVLMHATLSETWGGRFSSDHFPVFVRFAF